MLALVVLFTTAALIEARRCSSLSNLLGGDVWWHLSAGLWILHSHALPHNGVFSQSSRAWIAAGWLYDVKLAIYERLLGLRAIPVFAMFFKAALAVVTFLLAGGRKKFWGAIGLSAIAQYILGTMPPTPVFCSVIFFGIELLILLSATSVMHEGSARIPHAMWWLPPLFLVWANVDFYFVYGLALLAIWLVTNAAPGDTSRLSFGIAGACVVATLVSPYFYHPYQVFFAKAFGAANPYLPDYKAPGFRQPQDYVLALLAMGAFLALGLRRSRDLFLVAVLAGAVALSFHSQRDVWVTVLIAVAVIGEMISGDPARDMARTIPTANRALSVGIAATIAVLIAGAAILMPRSQSALLAKAAQAYPVDACDYVREHNLAQPLFNSYEWGGFLSYYLPAYPVVIDGRYDLYGDEFIIQYSKAMNAEIRYTDFPAMANARTILLPRSAIMGQALATLPGYKVAYRDEVATVIVKE
jgi:hypothetical protein